MYVYKFCMYIYIYIITLYLYIYHLLKKQYIIQTKGLENIISFTRGNSGQNKTFSKQIVQNCVTPIGKMPKARSLETPHDFFLITILFFFNNLWKFCMLISLIPLELPE